MLVAVQVVVRPIAMPLLLATRLPPTRVPLTQERAKLSLVMLVTLVSPPA